MSDNLATTSEVKRGFHPPYGLLKIALAIFILSVFFPNDAIAQESWDIDNEKTNYVALSMDAAMMQVLIQEISNGIFTAQWSGTSAKVTWTSDCIVSLEAGMIIPVFPESLQMTESERTLMDAAVEALKSHELHQVSIWEHFAHEIKRYHCPPNSDEIKAYWQKQIDQDVTDSNFGFKPYFAFIKQVK